ncbi:MAG: hypothetical protein ONB46_14540 [candidate division KSB1 bacterium]|nr:hypothetical protein [candidate division KSB1 bacterium]MDZ7364276.1 hypothetical protein [candidate division KSB1 bacterium]MDZ7404999.1 hypothetical protein [candidate division KSB1 bacterium]
MIKWLSEKLVRDGAKPLRFRLALGVSFGLHAALFILASLLAALLEMSPATIPPQVFEFIFDDDKTLKKTGIQKSSFAKKDAGTARPRVPPPMIRSTSNPLNETPTAEQEPFNPAKETDQIIRGPFSDVRLLDSTPTPRLASADFLAPKLQPHRFAMPSLQRQAILKKIRTLTTKPLAAALDSSFVWEKNGQRFQFEVRHLPAASATGFDELLIAVTTVDDDDTLSTQLRMRRLAFSQFAQFVDNWDPLVALHDDEFDGRFHSNTEMVISASGGRQPKFLGKVSTAAYSIRRSQPSFYLDDNEIFLAGLEKNAATIPVPRVFMGILADTSRSREGVKVFTEESWITFHHDGSYSWHSASAPQIEHRAKLSSEPHTIIGRGKARLHVKGVVRGMVLVYGENDIILSGDLLCARDPEIFSDSRDFVGLVSAKEIEVAPPSVTGPGDLKIQAALFARSRFRVPHLYTRETATLRIYGSLSAGSISATEPRYGTRIRFDKRFENMRPPNFPMADRYEIAEWDERWLVK